jgi:hypothetical protein
MPCVKRLGASEILISLKHHTTKVHTMTVIEFATAMTLLFCFSGLWYACKRHDHKVAETARRAHIKRITLY